MKTVKDNQDQEVKLLEEADLNQKINYLESITTIDDLNDLALKAGTGGVLTTINTIGDITIGSYSIKRWSYISIVYIVVRSNSDFDCLGFASQADSDEFYLIQRHGSAWRAKKIAIS